MVHGLIADFCSFVLQIVADTNAGKQNSQLVAKSYRVIPVLFEAKTAGKCAGIPLVDILAFSSSFFSSKSSKTESLKAFFRLLRVLRFFKVLFSKFCSSAYWASIPGTLWALFSDSGTCSPRVWTDWVTSHYGVLEFSFGFALPFARLSFSTKNCSKVPNFLGGGREDSEGCGWIAWMGFACG